MKETEVTVQVFDTFEKTDEILRSQGFRLIDSYAIFDRYFSKHANVAALSYAELIGGSFLVRTVETGKLSHKLIYKKKLLDENGTVVSEEKVKTDLGDADEAVRIFAFSGLEPYCELRNRSFIYEHANVCLALQVVDGLGTFIEYEEDETMKGLGDEEKIRRLTAVLTSLGLNLGSDFSCKKVYMMLHK